MQCTGRFPWRTSSVPALKALLTFPPAVFDILGHAVHFSSRERAFYPYGLTGCRELMERLLKQTFKGSSTSCSCKFVHLIGYIAINIFKNEKTKTKAGLGKLALNQQKGTFKEDVITHEANYLFIYYSNWNSTQLRSGWKTTLTIERAKFTKSKQKWHSNRQPSAYDTLIWLNSHTHTLALNSLCNHFLNVEKINLKFYTINYEVILFKSSILFDFFFVSCNCHVDNASLTHVKKLGKRGSWGWGHGGSLMLACKQCCFGEPGQ